MASQVVVGGGIFQVSADTRQARRALSRLEGELNGLRGQDVDLNIGADGQTAADIGEVTQSAGGLSDEISGLASNIPIVGNRLGGLGGRAALAAGGVGGAVLAVGALTGRAVALERELRPLIARSGLSAETLQTLGRAAEIAGGENGLESVTDAAQNLQERLSEAARDGAGPAADQLGKLGLSAEQLVEKDPSEQLLTLITALQGVENQADRTFLREELLGGQAENLAGILALTSEEFNNLTGEIEASGEVMSGSTFQATRMLSQSLDRLQGLFGGLLNALTPLAVVLTQLLVDLLTPLVEVLSAELAPIVQEVSALFVDYKEEIQLLIRGAIIPLVFAIRQVASGIGVVVAALRGDWETAWERGQDFLVRNHREMIESYLTLLDTNEAVTDSIERATDSTVALARERGNLAVANGVLRASELGPYNPIALARLEAGQPGTTVTPNLSAFPQVQNPVPAPTTPVTYILNNYGDVSEDSILRTIQNVRDARERGEF